MRLLTLLLKMVDKRSSGIETRVERASRLADAQITAHVSSHSQLAGPWLFKQRFVGQLSVPLPPNRGENRCTQAALPLTPLTPLTQSRAYGTPSVADTDGAGVSPSRALPLVCFEQQLPLCPSQNVVQAFQRAALRSEAQSLGRIAKCHHLGMMDGDPLSSRWFFAVPSRLIA
jgi:hypothetical protein